MSSRDVWRRAARGSSSSPRATDEPAIDEVLLGIAECNDRGSSTLALARAGPDLEGAASMTPRVLVTGPLHGLSKYSDAARGVGWEPVEHSLLSIEPHAFERAALGAEQVDWIAITSANALPWLDQAIAAVPELALLPCAVVGEHAAARVQERGLTLDDPWHLDAEELARAVAARAEPGARILWPRGSLSDDLAARMRESGFEVLDPLAYTTRPIDAKAPPALTEAVFFASPSAVRAWTDLPALDVSRSTAIAIGGTTFAALHGETAPAFFDTIRLPEPTPAAFAFVLAHLDVDRTP